MGKKLIACYNPDVIYILAFLVGFISSFIGAISTGASLISIPGLIFIGVAPVTAIATSRLSAVSSSLTVVYKYNKAKAVIWKYVPYFIVIAIIAGIIGPKLLVLMDPKLVSKVIGVLLILILPLLYIKNNFGTTNKQTSSKLKLIGLAPLFLVMIYATMFGIGGGIFLLYVLVYFYGLTVIEANATGNVVWLIGAFTALIAYILQGTVQFAIGIPMLIGASLGGYLGAHLAIKKGAAWVKNILAAVIMVSAIKLLFF